MSFLFCVWKVGWANGGCTGCCNGWTLAGELSVEYLDFLKSAAAIFNPFVFLRR